MATLKEQGFELDDLVTYESDEESTGGVIYRIVQNFDPIKPHRTEPGSNYRQPTHWDENGRQIATMKLKGYVRLRSFYEFFPTALGKNPKGANSTVLVWHPNFVPHAKKVDLTTLGVKYMELGNVLRHIAVRGGWQPDQES